VPTSISNAFRSKIESTLVNSLVGQFYIDGSGRTFHVLKYPVIRRESGRVVGGAVDIELNRRSSTIYTMITSKSSFQKDAEIKFGVVSGSTIDTVTVFKGKLSALRASRASVSATIVDVLDRLKERTIGTQDDPAVISIDNPADIAWYIVTNYGKLDSTKNDTNPDINYSAWSSWWAAFDNDTVKVAACFDGQTVLEALTEIAELTDSTIYGQGDGKLYFGRPTGVNTVYHTVTDSFIVGDVEIRSNAEDIVNKVTVGYGYDPSAETWDGEVTVTNTPSVNSWGLCHKYYDSTRVWYGTEAPAQTHAERVVYRRQAPNAEYRVKLPPRFFTVAPGDVVVFGSDITGIDSKYLVTQKWSFDIETGVVDVTLDEGLGAATAPLLNGFVLDDEVLGLLDKDYNPLI